MTIRACRNHGNQCGYFECTDAACQNPQHMVFDSYLALLQYDIAMSLSSGDLHELRNHCNSAPLIAFSGSREKAMTLVDHLSAGRSIGAYFYELMTDWGMNEVLFGSAKNSISSKLKNEWDLVKQIKNWLADRACNSLDRRDLQDYPNEFLADSLGSALVTDGVGVSQVADCLKTILI
ncbi:hypothetical protein [Bifidobacterium simiiventris]|uniref:hypothetical protein n=1 Tax=Bifidobacterium simiiventris TaxID=2834434 RepID=UPI001C56D5F0|nr:hypothetical protein [Bifidobacterium simiiventris]MBW3078583.1 hypothetical protein [Bifidobacterium simiiventris]